jgi:hypothetical protein
MAQSGNISRFQNRSYVLLNTPFWNDIENFRVALANIWLTEFCSVLVDWACATKSNGISSYHTGVPINTPIGTKGITEILRFTEQEIHNLVFRYSTFTLFKRNIIAIRKIRNEMIHETGVWKQRATELSKLLDLMIQILQ